MNAAGMGLAMLIFWIVVTLIAKTYIVRPV